jgi:pyruvate,water dikinase
MVQWEKFQEQLLLGEEDKKQGFWVQDDVHLAHAISPLFASFQIPAMSEGTKQAFENLKMPLLQFRPKLSDNRIYQLTLPYTGDFEQRLKEHKETVSPILPRMYQRMTEIIEGEFLPFYRELDEFRSLPSFTLEEARAKVVELFEFYKKAWQRHFEIVMPRASLTQALEHMYCQLTGEKDAAAIYEMLTGIMNKTLETDRALWQMAAQVKQSETLRTAFSAESGAEIRERLATREEGNKFLEQLQGIMEEYGYRTSNSHELMVETWVENPVYALNAIASFLRRDYDFEQEFATTVQLRKDKAEATFARMPDGELKNAFRQMYEWALESWGLDEDHHFYIDAMLPSKARLFLLKVGERLVQEGALEDREDIFQLYLDEVLGLLERPESAAEIVERHRKEYESNKYKPVPPFYGTPPKQGPDPMIERIFGGKPPEVDQQKRSFNGYAASQGTYTGTAKVVRGPEDFAKVGAGDVLVCKTTTPPWTVLFSVVGAVVTDAGGILSHAGTVAREYKLPAVVGTKVATTLVKDGDKVTVDGTNGVVYFGQI